MYIQPLECPKCHRKGRPGEEGFPFTQSGMETEIEVRCECGNTFKDQSIRDQLILSANPFARLLTLSNHVEFGKISILPGRTAKVSFQKRFDYPCKAFFTPERPPIIVKELELRKDGMTLLSSFPNNIPCNAVEEKVSWTVYGLVDIDDLPNWYVHFYSAVTQTQNGLYKAALLDYAVAFEAFIESFLLNHLRLKYGGDAAEYLVKRTWNIEKRVKDLLELTIGHRLSEQKDIYDDWDKHVRKPRNDLSHGKRVSVSIDDVEKAHQVIYQAVRWIESIAV